MKKFLIIICCLALSGAGFAANYAGDLSAQDVTVVTTPIHWWACDQVINNADPNTFFLIDSVSSIVGSIVNDGTYYAAFPKSAAGINGDYGTSFSMSRAAIRVNFGRDLSWDLGTDDFTLSGWIQPAMPTSHARVMINGAWNQGGYSITILKNNGRLTFEVFSGSAVDADNISVTTTDVVTDNLWHNFIAVSSANKIYLYIDGILQPASGVAYKTTTTATCTTAWATPRPSNYLGQNMVGQFDDLRIYNTELSSTVDAQGNLIGGQAYNLWQGVAVDGPASCEEIWAAGYGLAQDYNHDCSVDSIDLSVIALQWLSCNDPADPNCEKPWL